MTDREIMQQALKMIRSLRYRSLTDVSDEIISALEERLAQPEQESFSNEAISATQAAWKMGYDAAKAEQPEQEPVAWECLNVYWYATHGMIQVTFE